MLKQKTKFRLRVLLVVESMIILTAISLGLYHFWFIPTYSIDYNICGLESVECPDEVKWYDFQEIMAQIAEYKQSRTYVIEVISEVAHQEGLSKDMMIKVHNCETARTTNLYNEDDPYNGADGYYQIILYWHPEVNRECAYDVWCSARYFAKQVKMDNGSLWTCYRKYQAGLLNN